MDTGRIMTKFFRLAKPTPLHREWATIYQRNSLIDLNIPLHVLLFLRSMSREGVKHQKQTERKFSIMMCLIFSFLISLPRLIIISPNFLRDTRKTISKDLRFLKTERDSGICIWGARLILSNKQRRHCHI